MEIRTFYSLKEFRENLEQDIEQFETLMNDYSQWLGTLLRDPESSNSQRSLDLQKAFKAGRSKGGKRSGKIASSIEWIELRDLLLCTDEFGEAEVLFEAVEELHERIDKLRRARDAVGDLERHGLGKEIHYTAYIRDGVPERIVLKTEKTSDPTKFSFTSDFSIQEQP